MTVATVVDSPSHWRAHIDTVIAVLRQEPDQLVDRGLRFEDDHDGLDVLRHARLEIPSGKVFALVRHRGAPTPGTEVVTRDNSPSLLEDLEDALAQLRLTRDDLVWEHPTISAVRHAEALLPQVATTVRALVLTVLGSLIGAGLAALFKSDEYLLVHRVGLGLLVVANVIAAALIVPAYRRIEGFLPAPPGSLTHVLRRLLSRKRTSSGARAT